MGPKPKTKNSAAASIICEHEEPDFEATEEDPKEMFAFLKAWKKESKSDFELLRKEMKDMGEAINRVSDDVSKLQDVQGILAKKVDSLEIELHAKEQRSRNYSIRIFNFKLPEECKEPVEVLNLVFKVLVEPSLRLAADKGEIDVVPPMHLVLEYGHPLKKKDATKPVPIFVRFCSRIYKLLFLKNKKTILEALNAKQGGKAFVTEDLTSTALARLKELQADARISKAFTLNGQIRYSLVSNPSRIITLKNPFTEITDE